MDRYQKVEKPKPESPINENEIRITAQGAIRNYISYATSLLQVYHRLTIHLICIFMDWFIERWIECGWFVNFDPTRLRFQYICLLLVGCGFLAWLIRCRQNAVLGFNLWGLCMSNSSLPFCWLLWCGFVLSAVLTFASVIVMTWHIFIVLLLGNCCFLSHNNMVFLF